MSIPAILVEAVDSMRINAMARAAQMLVLSIIPNATEVSITTRRTSAENLLILTIIKASSSPWSTCIPQGCANDIKLATVILWQVGQGSELLELGFDTKHDIAIEAAPRTDRRCFREKPPN